MLRFFRINDPYRLLAILLLILLFALPLLLQSPPLTVPELRALLIGEEIANGSTMYVELYDSTAPFAAGLFGLMDWLFGRSLVARDILALCLLFFQASFFAILLINNKAYNDSTYVPGLIFAILCFVSFDFLSFSPELLASTLLLLALNNLFREIEFRIQREETVLNLGVYLGGASIFVFSYSLFLIASLVILIVYARLSLRKALLLVFGFALPHLVLFLIYLRWDQTDLLMQNFYAPNLVGARNVLIGWGSLFYLFVLPVGYFVISLFMLNRDARFTKYQSQLFQVMFLWLLFCMVEVLLTKELTPHSFITTIPALTYFISHYLLLIRRRWIAEIMLWVFLSGVLLVSNLSRTNAIGAINYSQLQVGKSDYAAKIMNQRVLILGDDLPLLQNNKMGGYFLSWSLSKQTVEEMDAYENVLRVNAAFKNNPPDVIVDKNNRMPAILARIPSLQLQYRQEGTIYRRIKKDSGTPANN